MASESAVMISHPSPAALKVINPVMKFLIGTPLAGQLRQQLMVLEFTGRKSGKPYSALVSSHHIDGATYALTNAPWKANFIDGPTVQMVHNRRTTTMKSEYIRDANVVADLSHRIATQYGAKRAQRSMGYQFRDSQTVPSLEDFLTTVGSNGIIAIRLTPAG
jgi:hypothetical protein